jgi:transcriptional regulator with GAF, ATPase, and Fis domain
MVGNHPDNERRRAVRLTLREHLAQQRRAYLRAVLKEAGGNVSEAARIAGLNRTALHGALVREGIKAPRRQWAARGNSAWQSLGH